MPHHFSLRMATHEAIQAGDKMFKWAKYSSLVTGAGYWVLSSSDWSKFGRILFRIYSTIQVYNMYLVAIQSVINISIIFLVKKDTQKTLNCLNYVCAFTWLSARIYQFNKEDIAVMVHSTIKNGNGTSKIYKVAARSTIKYCEILNMAVLVFNTMTSASFIYENFLAFSTGRSMPFEGWYPFDTSSYHTVILWLDMFRALVGAVSCNSCTQTLLISIILDCVGRLKVLQYKFANFHSQAEREERNAYNLLKELIKEHNENIEYVTNLNDAIKNILFLEYNISSIMIASFLLQSLQGINVIFNFITALVLSLQLVLLCWNVNEIQVHIMMMPDLFKIVTAVGSMWMSIQVGDAAYKSLWYEYDPSIRQAAQLAILRSSRPLRLTVGPFSALTANSGLEVLKVAYTYLTLVYGKKP